MADISQVKVGSTTYDIKDKSAITDITRSGTTFTATKHDGTTFTFTQQDNNTTYTPASSVTSVATTSAVGTSTAYARQDHVHDITKATITSALGYTPPTAQEVTDAFKVNDAMLFKGTLGTGGTATALPTTHYQGWTYKVITAGTWAGKVCEVGDMIICITDGTAANNDHWTVVQTNIDGAVTGPASATGDRFASFNGTSGKIIKDSGYSASSFAAAGHNHDSAYVNVSGDTMTGNLFSTGAHIGFKNSAEADKFFDFGYADPTASTAPGASWRIAALNSGSGDTNYLVIQTGGSATDSTTWNNAIRLGMNTLDAAFGGNVYPTTNNAKTLGTSSLKWSTVYATTFNGDLTGNAATASDAAKLNGYASDTAASNNTIARRTANGYINATYFNQSSGAETPTTSSYIIYANSDGYLRKSSLANIKSILGLGSNAYTSTAYVAKAGDTMSGDLTLPNLKATGSVCANTANSGTAGGLALYGTSPTDYGIAFRQTSNGSKHGGVQGDWAQYHYMAGATNRGWVFKAAGSNVASIDGLGDAVFNGYVTIGGNAANTSGCKQQYNITTQALDFIFS